MRSGRAICFRGGPEELNYVSAECMHVCMFVSTCDSMSVLVSTVSTCDSMSVLVSTVSTCDSMSVLVSTVSTCDSMRSGRAICFRGMPEELNYVSADCMHVCMYV
jgi:hypothetical protein